jgi:hypothetical protein
VLILLRGYLDTTFLERLRLSMSRLSKVVDVDAAMPRLTLVASG